jgi:phosphoglycolate phosphatase
MDALPAATVASYVGNGAPVLIRRAMGDDAPQSLVEEALSYFLAYYREHMLDNTRPYPGVREALAELDRDGVRMAVLTNKPERFSRDMCAGLGLGKYFFRVYGGNSFEQKKPDPVGILTLAAEAGVPLADTWMVGDSATDVQTARNAGVQAVGVTYGISPASLDEVPPDIRLDRLEALPKLVRGAHGR